MKRPTVSIVGRFVHYPCTLSGLKMPVQSKQHKALRSHFRQWLKDYEAATKMELGKIKESIDELSDQGPYEVPASATEIMGNDMALYGHDLNEVLGRLGLLQVLQKRLQARHRYVLGAIRDEPSNLYGLYERFLDTGKDYQNLHISMLREAVEGLNEEIRPVQLPEKLD